MSNQDECCDGAEVGERIATAVIPWDDLSIEDKIERMRNVVKGVQNRMRTIDRRTSTFDSHRHDPNTGDPMVPARGNRLIDYTGDTIKGYF